MMRTVSVAVYVEDESTNAATRIPTNSGFGPRETSSNVVERVLTFVLTLPILGLDPLICNVEARVVRACRQLVSQPLKVFTISR